MACDARMMEMETRVATVQTIAGHMQDALEIQREVGEHGICAQCLSCGRRCTSYVTCLYVLIKLMYTLNVIGQIFLLNSFLGTENIFYGFRILNDLMNGRQWEESGNFPRVTLCDFEVRVLGNVHHHTVQCGKKFKASFFSFYQYNPFIIVLLLYI